MTTEGAKISPLLLISWKTVNYVSPKLHFGSKSLSVIFFAFFSLRQSTISLFLYLSLYLHIYFHQSIFSIFLCLSIYPSLSFLYLSINLPISFYILSLCLSTSFRQSISIFFSIYLSISFQTSIFFCFFVSVSFALFLLTPIVQFSADILLQLPNL
jgi:hypothetical protein